MVNLTKLRICAILGSKVVAGQGHRGIHERCADYSTSPETMEQTITELVDTGYMKIGWASKPPIYEPTEMGLNAIHQRSRRKNVQAVAHSIIRYNQDEIRKERQIIQRMRSERHAPSTVPIVIPVGMHYENIDHRKYEIGKVNKFLRSIGLIVPERSYMDV